ncbi:MAG: hypothetical protein ABR82_03910 [Verrucomicrobia subdivision 6 bacterium BACL9 MAG-120507-bin52]|uniref:Uncharacterized protein n=2 Tax=Verrucomicrobia subdivision 6 TaxID=134627 RepID=A0A0R2RJC8_9BACT|nr:MAG: hypothetical protein ABR82_03910 [Verrucomicrobia subdivision 6 bacterium BACL9 MAG-120507-bin52]
MENSCHHPQDEVDRIMVLTAMTLGAVGTVAVVAQLLKHRKNIPHFPLWVGFGLTILIPSVLIVFVIELMALFAWNPLIWME